MSSKVSLWSLGACTLFILTLAVRGQQELPSPEELEMGSVETARTAARNFDPAVLAKFKAEYDTAKEAPRAVFDKYIPLLGASVLLDFIEETFPVCHGQSHDLGKALFAASNDLGSALRECGTRCTSGCMHGAVGEAFGSSSPEAISAQMNTFCGEGEMARLHKPGNCAHGLGHALMFVNAGDVRKSIDACLGFRSEPMQYYCATGVFMEKILTGPKPATPPPSIHSPCDEETLFPSACYRYKAADLLRLRGDAMGLTLECLGLEGPTKLGCFHGLGAALTTVVFSDPARIGSICSKGDRNDRIACIEGVIEKLADHDQNRAALACRSIGGDMRKVCEDALREKMYSLTKPTFALYYDKGAVARRKATLGAPAKAEDHSHHGHGH